MPSALERLAYGDDRSSGGGSKERYNPSRRSPRGVSQVKEQPARHARRSQSETTTTTLFDSDDDREEEEEDRREMQIYREMLRGALLTRPAINGTEKSRTNNQLNATNHNNGLLRSTAATNPSSRRGQPSAPRRDHESKYNPSAAASALLEEERRWLLSNNSHLRKDGVIKAAQQKMTTTHDTPNKTKKTAGDYQKSIDEVVKVEKRRRSVSFSPRVQHCYEDDDEEEGERDEEYDEDEEEEEEQPEDHEECEMESEEADDENALDFAEELFIQDEPSASYDRNLSSVVHRFSSAKSVKRVSFPSPTASSPHIERNLFLAFPTTDTPTSSDAALHAHFYRCDMIQRKSRGEGSNSGSKNKRMAATILTPPAAPPAHLSPISSLTFPATEAARRIPHEATEAWLCLYCQRDSLGNYTYCRHCGESRR